MLCVPELHLHAISVACLLFAADLPIPGEARLHALENPGSVAKFRKLRRTDHSWTHQAHLPAENIPQLRHFVHTPPSYHSAHRRNTRIILEFKVPGKFFS